MTCNTNDHNAHTRNNIQRRLQQHSLVERVHPTTHVQHLTTIQETILFPITGDSRTSSDLLQDHGAPRLQRPTGPVPTSSTYVTTRTPPSPACPSRDQAKVRSSSSFTDAKATRHNYKPKLTSSLRVQPVYSHDRTDQRRRYGTNAFHT